MRFRQGKDENDQTSPRIMIAPHQKSVLEIKDYLLQLRRISKNFNVTLLDASEALVRLLEENSSQSPNLTVVIEEGQVSNELYRRIFGVCQTAPPRESKDVLAWYRSNWFKKNSLKSPVVTGKVVKELWFWKEYKSIDPYND